MRWRATAQNGKVLTIGQSAKARPRSGTTISVHELFHNMPVRWKQMVADGKKQVVRVREKVVRLALIHNAVGISLYDACDRCQVLATRVRLSPPCSTLQPSAPLPAALPAALSAALLCAFGFSDITP